MASWRQKTVAFQNSDTSSHTVTSLPTAGRPIELWEIGPFSSRRPHITSRYSLHL